LCCNFVKASLAGWKYTFEHPEEALDIVMHYARKGMNFTNRVHQRWMLDRMKDIIIPQGNDIPLGRLEAEDYHRVVQELSKRSLITHSPSFSEFFVDCGSHD
jgi:NitT/TauT family transport system substrate-binding protein